MSVIKSRCYRQLDSHQKFEQAGFRKKFSTIDHIQALSQLIEKTNEFNIKVALMFIDYNKAFDSLYYDKIWETLAKQGIHMEIINVLEKIYASCTAQIRLDTKGRLFNIRRGVRQGDPFSPIIFNAVLEQVFSQVDWKGKGIMIKTRGSDLFDYTWLNNLRFADDVVLVAKSSKELKAMADGLAKASAEVGLTINKTKTNILTNIENLEEIKIDNEKIARVEEYKYLGQTLSFSDKSAKELKIRRANGWKAFWAKKSIWQSKLKLNSKIKIFESTITPVLAYGAQTWAGTKGQTKKMQTTQNAMLRKILSVRLMDKIRLEDIFRRTKARNVGGVAKLLKYRYAGHVIRDCNLKWSKILTTWVPHMGRRNRGCPRTRWSDEINKHFGSSWARLAKDRGKWKGLVDAHAQKWMVEGAYRSRGAHLPSGGSSLESIDE